MADSFHLNVARQLDRATGAALQLGDPLRVRGDMVGNGGARGELQRADAPREVHIWTMTLDGADRALAEQIAQSVDVR